MANKPATQEKEASEKVSKVLADLQQMTGKKIGDINFMSLSDKPLHMPRISSGIPALDSAIGGGLPLGKIVEIYGLESSGKTTCATVMLGAAQRAGLVCGIVDVEHAFDPAWAVKNGVNIDELIFVQPSYGEEATEAVKRMFQSGVNFVVLDSVAALVPKEELEGEMSDMQMGLQARMMGKFTRSIIPSLQDENILVCINQVRDKVGVMFGSPETTSGGKALKFASSIRMRVGGSANSTKDGRDLKVVVHKNKTAPPFKTAEFSISSEYGLDYVGSAVDLGIIEKGGAWYTLPFEENGEKVRLQGINRVYAWLKENGKDNELRDKINDAVEAMFSLEKE